MIPFHQKINFDSPHSHASKHTERGRGVRIIHQKIYFDSPHPLARKQTHKERERSSENDLVGTNNICL